LARKYTKRKDPTLDVSRGYVESAVEGLSPENPLYYVWRVPPGRFSFFFDQLSQMLHAGMSIHEALLALRQGALDRRLSAAAAAMAPAISAGGSFSEQLARYPELFPAHVRGLIKAAEYSGHLDIITAQIAADYRAKQKSAWAILLAQLWFSIPLVLVLFVVPLPRIIDLGVGWYVNFILRISLPILFGCVVLYYLSKMVFNLRSVRAFRDRVLYALPMASLLIRRAATRRYLLALESLVGAGVEIQQAMELAAESAGNAVIEVQLTEAAEKVRNGMPIGQALMHAKAVPVEIRQSLETAERSGNYDQALKGLQEWAEQQQTTTVRFAGIGGYGIVMALVGIIVAVAVGYSYFSYVQAILNRGDEWMP